MGEVLLQLCSAALAGDPQADAALQRLRAPLQQQNTPNSASSDGWSLEATFSAILEVLAARSGLGGVGGVGASSGGAGAAAFGVFGGGADEVGVFLHVFLLARDATLGRYAELRGMDAPTLDRCFKGLVEETLRMLLLPALDPGQQQQQQVSLPLVNAACQFLAVACKRCSNVGAADSDASTGVAGSPEGFLVVRKLIMDTMVQHLSGFPANTSAEAATMAMLVLCRALVVEFSADARASAMACTWEFHRACAAQFQVEMVDLFSLSVEVARVAAGADSTLAPHVRVLRSALELLLEMLSWDFSVASSDNFSLAARTSSEAAASDKPWRPSLLWSDALHASNLPSLLLQIVGAFVATDPELVHLAVQCAGQAASIPVGEILNQLVVGQSRDDLVFTQPDTGAETLLGWLTSLVGGVSDMLSQLAGGFNAANTVASGETDTMVRLYAGSASLVCRLASSGALSAPLQNEVFAPHIAGLLVPLFAGGFVRFFDSCWQFLVAVAEQVPLGTGLVESDHITQLEECVDSILSAVVILIPKLHGSEVLQTASLHGHELFLRYLEGRSLLAPLELLAETGELEVDGAEPDFIRFSDQLESVGFLARLNVTQSCLRVFESINAEWTTVRTTTGPAREQAVERLSWLYMIAAAFFADNPHGEIPCTPEAFAMLDEETSRSCVVGAMKDAFLAPLFVGDVDSVRALLQLLSPYSVSVLIWAVTRWCGTYPCAKAEEDGSPILCEHFSVTTANSDEVHEVGQGLGPGVAIIDAFVSLLAAALVEYSSERVVLAQVATAALFVSRSSALGPAALHGTAWGLLGELCLPPDGTSSISISVPLGTHVKLTQALINIGDHVQGQQPAADAAGAFNPFEAARMARAEYFERLVAPTHSILGPLLEMAQRNFPEDRAAIQAASQQQSVLTHIARLRGVARAAISDEALIFQICMQYFQPLLLFMDIFKGSPNVVAQICRFFRDFAENQAENLADQLDDEDPEEGGGAHAVFFEATLRMFEAWNVVHSDRVSRERGNVVSSTLADADADEQARDVITQLSLLRVLTGLCSFFEFDEGGLATDEGAQQLVTLVVRGVAVILPHVNEHLLGFPKLRSALFGLIHSILADCLPFLAPVISADTLELVLHTADDLGLSHFDPEIVRLSLEALGGFGRFVFDGGLVDQFAGSVNRVLTAVMTYVFFGDFSRDLLSPCAEALLPLALCSQELFSATVAEIIQRYDRDDALISRGFEQLLVGVEASVSFRNLRVFERNLELLLVTTKSMVARK